MNQNDQNHPVEQRPLSDEEKRRIMAARRAAMQRAQMNSPNAAQPTAADSHRISRDGAAPRRINQSAAQNGGHDPYRSAPDTADPRRIDPGTTDPYRSRTPYGRDPDAQRRLAADRARGAVPRTQQHRATIRRRKKPVRFNVGLIAFLVMIAIVLGVSLWQIIRAKNTADDGTVPNRTASVGEAAESGETGVTGTDEPSGEGALETPAEGENSTAGQTAAAPDNGSAAAGTTGSENAAPQSPVVNTPAETPAGAAGVGTQTGGEAEINLTLYDTVQVNSARLSEGSLVLVNGQHSYSAGDTIELKNIYNEKSAAPGTIKLKLANNAVSLAPPAFAALVKLASDLEADTGCHDLHVTSAHRTVAEQQQVWDYYLAERGEEYCNDYVAKPGYSEHNTGLACDLSFFTDEGASVSIADSEFRGWLEVNCAREGFIRRYAEDKVDVTGIANEPWHFRYVGVPHAYICTVKNWCLEEYVENVKAYTAEGTMLRVTAAGEVTEVRAADGLPTSDGWLVYYAPKTYGTETSVKVPRGSDYEISGNNVDGYIVTIVLD